MKNMRWLLLFFAMHTIHAHSMARLTDNQYQGKQVKSRSNKKVLVPQKKKENEQVLIEPSFCAILQQKIFTISSLCSMYTCLKDAAITTNALAKTNRFLNSHINDADNALKLIKQFSRCFDCSNMDVAEKLGTKEANNRWAIQYSLLANWNHRFNSPNFNKIKKIGVDLNFTYGETQHTALIKNASSCHYGFAEVGEWLIENGADINICGSDGRNAFMMACGAGNTKLMNCFLSHPQFNVEYKDNNGDTLLHYCFYSIQCKLTKCLWSVEKGCSYSYEYNLVEQLLKKGANPTIKNKNDKTPFDLARETKNQSFIELLEKAVADFNSQKNSEL